MGRVSLVLTPLVSKRHHGKENGRRTSVSVCAPASGYGWTFDNSHPNLRREHLLMGLNFLQCYRTEEVASPVFEVGAKNYRQWVWFVIGQIANLEYVGNLNNLNSQLQIMWLLFFIDILGGSLYKLGQTCPILHPGWDRFMGV